MEEIILLLIFYGLPILFLILSIKNIVEIVKAKKAKTQVKKSIIAKAIIFSVIFLAFVCFYIWLMYSLSRSLANM